MPSVDDLVISLTIKETGDLGKLKKSLDSLTGSRSGGLKGVVPSFMYLKRDLIGIKTDTQEIKKRMVFLQPTRIPIERESQKETARIQHALISANREALIDKMITKDKNALKSMMEANDIKTEEELRQFLGAKLEEYQFRLEEVMKGIITDSKAEQLLLNIKNLLSAQDLSTGLGKGLMDAVDKVIAEFQHEMEKLLATRGIPSKAKFLAWRPNLTVLERGAEGLFNEIKKQGFSTDPLTLMKSAGITDMPKMEEEWKNIQGLIHTSRNTISFLNDAAKTLKFKLTPETFTDEFAKNSDILKMITAGMTWLWGQRHGTPETGGFPAGVKGIFERIIKDVYGVDLPKIDDIYKLLEMDLAVFGGDLGELKMIFGAKLAKVITDNAVHFIELKKRLDEGSVNQAIRERNMFGKNMVSFVAATVQQSFRNVMPDVLTKVIPSIMGKLQEAGAIEKMTEDELNKIKEDFGKKVTSELLMSGVKQAIENVKTMIPEEMYKKLTSSNEWNNIVTDISNQELWEDLKDEFHKLEDVEGKNLNADILRVLKLLLSSMKQGSDVVSLGPS